MPELKLINLSGNQIKEYPQSLIELINDRIKKSLPDFNLVR